MAAGVAASQLAGVVSSSLLGKAASGVLGTAVSTAIGGASSAVVGTAASAVGGQLGSAIAGPVGGILGGGPVAGKIPSATDVAAKTASALAGGAVPGIAGKAAAMVAGSGVTTLGSVLSQTPAVPGLGDLASRGRELLVGGSEEGVQFEFEAPPARQERLRVVSFTGREAISELYHLEIVLSTPWSDEELEQGVEETLLGQPAHLTIHDDEGDGRIVHGIVTAFDLEGSSPEVGRPCVRVTLAPRLWLATQRMRSRIFQDRTVKEIVDAVLAEWDVAHSWSALEKWAPRTYCTQYEETDYQFIVRLLAEEGVFFFFVHSEGGEELVLCDHERACPPISAPFSVKTTSAADREVPRPELYVRSGAHCVADDDQSVLEFKLRRLVRPNATLLTGYDHRRPGCLPQGSARLASAEDRGEAPGRRGMLTPVVQRKGELLVHDHHPRADYESTPRKEQVDGPQANKLLDQLRRDSYVGEGESLVWWLVPGHAFQLAGHPLDRLDHGYVVTEVEHSGRAALAGKGSGVYRNRFKCIPAEVRYRPPVPPRRMVQVAETATVVGTGGEEIETDAQGRIRVRFHWDLGEGQAGGSSCWIRVAQPWAGAGWGHQFIPRVGCEVLVVFLRGDPDSPLVTGSTYNGANPVPFLLPESKSRSGIRTSSSPGGMGYNELSFEDAVGMEEIHLRAERNLSEEVRNDHLIHVGHNQVVTVDGVRHDFVKGARFETVLGTSAAEVLLGRAELVGGSHVTRVGGDRNAEVEGAESRTIQGDQSLRVRGNRTLWVNGYLSTQVGTQETPAEVLLNVLGRQSTSATGSLTFHSEKQIVLECGSSRVVIGPEEVRIETKRIVASAEESVLIEADGPALELTDQVELSGQAVKLYAQAASLELGSNADLNGTQVNLNCGGGSGGAGAEGQKSKQKPVKLMLHDESMKPFANKKFRLMAGGMKLEGTTDGEGGLSEQVPEEAQVGQLTLWVDEYPTGTTLEWTIALVEAAVPPANVLSGALHRLTSLGYYQGEVVETITPEVEEALRWFQEDYQLETTGELDQATAAKLKEIQGV